jgi:sterol desaturase/sphingolipid hydroxylase (fatty acid hydroxylase superfamily)
LRQQLLAVFEIGWPFFVPGEPTSRGCATRAAMNVVRTAASWIVWPLMLGGLLLAFGVTQRLGLDPASWLFGLTVAHLALIAGLELLMPARRDWDWRKDGQVFNDLVHGALLGVGARIGALALTVGIAAAASMIGSNAPLNVWPTQWPLWGQVGLAVILYDFADYWKHRAYHDWAWAWPIHALHHNPTRMHIFKAGRLHLLEATVRAFFAIGLLVVLGPPSPVLFWLAALLNAFGNTNHWNVETRVPRILNWLLATPAVHWLHHAKDLPDGSRNLSPFTMLFDHLFRTYEDPSRRLIADVGIAFDPIPKDLIGQIASPIAWPWLARRARRANLVPRS